MSRDEFKHLKVGDTVVINGLAGVNAGIKCEVMYILADIVAVHVIDVNEKLSGKTVMSPRFNEYSYKVLNFAG